MALVRRFTLVSLLVFSLSLHAVQVTAASELPDDSAAARADGEAARRSVPRVTRFSGSLRNDSGDARTGTIGLSFAIYNSAQGGAPLWHETHNVVLDEQGRYSVLLGRTSQGLPIALFATGEARWLGVRIAEDGATEQPRVILVSVPYALAAADAQSLGGRPATDFQLTRAAATASGDVSLAPGVEISATSGTTGKIAKFTSATDLGDSVMTESAGQIGIGTTTPRAILELFGPANRMRLSNATTGQNITDGFQMGSTADNGVNIEFWNWENGFIRFGTNNGEVIRVTADGKVGIGTATPPNKLTVFGPANRLSLQNTTTGGAATDGFQLGSTADNGINIEFWNWENGFMRFATNNAEVMRLATTGNVGIGSSAPSQKLEVAGTIYSTTGGFRFPDGSTQTTAAVCSTNCTGTISAVTAGAGLTGGGTTGAVTLNANLAASSADSGMASTIARGDHVHDARYLALTGGTLSGALVVNRTENASALNEIRFADNGQIRSLDNNHRIIFDRSGSAIELREFGDVILSPGATAGTRTAKARFWSNGQGTMTSAKGSYTWLEDNETTSGTVLLNRLTGTGTIGPQQRYTVSSVFEWIDVGMDSARNYVIEVNDAPAVTVQRDLNVRMPGMLRLGVENGTGDVANDGLPDYSGLVIRRVISKEKANGTVVAKTDKTNFTRDGSNGGFNAASAATHQSFGCTGLTASGAVLGNRGNIDPAGPSPIWQDSQNVVYFTCSFGNPYDALHVTQLVMQREAGDWYWVGTVTSSVNQ
jgi:hypothetical protein